jgi:hypothetical protein
MIILFSSLLVIAATADNAVNASSQLVVLLFDTIIHTI